MWEGGLLAEVREVFQQEGRLIRLPEGKTIVFVGDTHGDRQATCQVLGNLAKAAVIVFLGDYVDRGPDSEGNLRLLLETKLARKDQIYLLMGNHEGWAVTPFSPADFWHRLDPIAERVLSEALSFLPFAAYHPAGVLALHGALPDVRYVDDIGRIKLGSADWRKITWGDWIDAPGYVADSGIFGRPTFGRDYFVEVMDRLKLRALIRSHQPFAPTFLFEDRCLTIFSSNAYGGTERRVAILRPGKAIYTARDLELVRI